MLLVITVSGCTKTKKVLIEGLPGINGFNGIKGDKGDRGSAGTPGPAGSIGEKGEQGNPGTQGLKGDIGQTGTSGLNGNNGANSVIKVMEANDKECKNGGVKVCVFTDTNNNNEYDETDINYNTFVLCNGKHEENDEAHSQNENNE